MPTTATTRPSAPARPSLDHPDRFVRRHVGPSEADVRAMLETLGFASLDALVDATIPAAIRMKRGLELPKALHEHEALARMREIAAQNRVWRSYLGMGYSDTLTPPVIQRNVLENPGWYTQYTPYQAEISQGRLEVLLAFQTMVCDLTGMAIANASMLDEATAAAEAMHLCFAVGKPEAKTFFVSSACHPQTIEVVKTRAKPHGIRVVVGDAATYDFAKPTAGVLVQYPATDGAIDDLRPLAERAHAAGALFVVAADVLALTLLESPGAQGADVVVGSTQRFGVPMGYGGPHAGYLATKDEFKRQLPGRLVGVSKDVDGAPAMRLALGTREQHIRRERATSNICTAQVLLAIVAATYAVYHGPEGLAAIARRVRRLTGVLARGLERLGLSTGRAPFFDTLRVEVGDARKAILKAAAARKINLRALSPTALGVALDEATSKEDVADLLEVFAGGTAPSFTVDDLLEGGDAPALPESLARTTEYLTHPVFHEHRSETELLRWLHGLQEKDLSLTTSMIPLGSCTMKLNATVEMMPVTWPEFGRLHPFAPTAQAKGYAEVFQELETWLAEITGFAAVSLQPNAGSQGEYAGLLVIREWHRSRGEGKRDVCLIPQSAHGTNPASAVMAGMRVVVVATDPKGNVDLDDLRAKATENKERLAALMITYPSTHGVFEESIREICDVVHGAGGQVYMDGANMNAQVGLCRPGDFGPDVCHLNLHKTFCLAEGTPVALANGTSRRIEEIARGDRALAWSSEERGVRAREVVGAFPTGRKPCVEVTLQDGRTITCTDDHRVLTTEGWIEAGDLDPARHRVVIGPVSPLDNREPDEGPFRARFADLELSLSSESNRSKAQAFFRLLGAVCSDGTHARERASGRSIIRLNFGTRLDAARAVEDVHLLCGAKPTISTPRSIFSVRLPADLVRAMESVPGFGAPGRRTSSPRVLPDPVCDPSTPRCLVREFLGGLFGGDGAAPTIVHLDRAPHAMKGVRFVQSRDDAAVLDRLLDQVRAALARFGIDAEPSRVLVARTGAAVAGRWHGLLEIVDGLAFAERVGFRYCAHKTARLTAASCWWRLRASVRAQRREVARMALATVGESRRAGPNAVWGPAVAEAFRSYAADHVVLNEHFAAFRGNVRVTRQHLAKALESPRNATERRSHVRSVGAATSRDGTVTGMPRLEDFLCSIGAREWFNRHTRRGSPYRVTYAAKSEAPVEPALQLGVLAVKAVGDREVYDLTVDELHSFLANGVVVHNCIPHGGGGPGMGPIAVAKHLAPFLPGHPIVKVGGAKRIGPVSAAPWGSPSILVIPWVYIACMGPDGLTRATQVAILSANYMAKRLEPHYPVLYKGVRGTVAHEFILDLRRLKEQTGIDAIDVAKRLMDYGFHAPTVSFPVAGTLMVEPTESESKDELDRLCDALIAIRKEIADVADGRADRQDNPVKNAPHTAAMVTATDWNHAYSREQAAFPAPWTRKHKFWPSVGRIDDVYGDRNLVCSCVPIEAYAQS
jgi:glycine dehydrogenase